MNPSEDTAGLSAGLAGYRCGAISNPEDCGWPFCGCDPAADKVLAAIQEHDMEIVPVHRPQLVGDLVERLVVRAALTSWEMDECATFEVPHPDKDLLTEAANTLQHQAEIIASAKAELEAFRKAQTPK